MRIIILCVFTLFISCQSQQSESVVGLRSFFDLEEYFSEEIDRLSEVAKLEKTVTYDGKEEQKVITDFNLKEELSLFSESNINNPNWADKYQVDTIYTSGKSIGKIVHTSLEDKLSVKKISIEFLSGEVSKIEIEKESDTAIADSYQALTYTPGKGYFIKNKQAITFSAEHELSVRVNYLN